MSSKTVHQKRQFQMTNGPQFDNRGKVILRTSNPNALSRKIFKDNLQQFLGISRWSDLTDSFVPEYDHRDCVKKDSIIRMVNFLNEESERENVTKNFQKNAKELVKVFKAHC